jgi:hypothetical protein
MKIWWKNSLWGSFHYFLKLPLLSTLSLARFAIIDFKLLSKNLSLSTFLSLTPGISCKLLFILFSEDSIDKDPFVNYTLLSWPLEHSICFVSKKSLSIFRSGAFILLVSIEFLQISSISLMLIIRFTYLYFSLFELESLPEFFSST